MKRWPLRISPRRAAFGGTLCLILGAVTTVAVAWALAWSVDLTWMEPQTVIVDLPDHDVEEDRIEIREFLAATGARRVVQVQSTASPNPTFGTRLSIPYKTRTRTVADPDVGDFGSCFHDTEPAAGIGYVSDARGWPCLALAGGFDFSWMVGTPAIKRTHSAIALQDANEMVWLYGSLDERRAFLPLYPLKVGFLINTLFYAAIWLGLLFGFTTLRRTIRRRRGQCPMCAYYLRGDTPHPQPLSQGERGGRGCPECGWNRDNGVSTPPV